jgi:hypothetical protein
MSIAFFIVSRPKEGIRYYLTHEKFEEAKEEALRVAKFNKKEEEA